jgi:hypothetical protein
MERNSLTINDFTIYPVDDFSIFTGFSCLSPEDKDQDLNDFIQHDAERHLKDRIAVTYTLIHRAEPSLALAFATLQNDSITTEPKDLPEVRTAYPYTAYPAVKIGRLGVRLEYQNSRELRLGSLFLFMLKCLMMDSNRTGCRFITVDARRDKKNHIDTTPFYEKNGFTLLTCREKTSRYIPMYFDLKTMEPTT